MEKYLNRLDKEKEEPHTLLTPKTLETPQTPQIQISSQTTEPITTQQ